MLRSYPRRQILTFGGLAFGITILGACAGQSRPVPTPVRRQAVATAPAAPPPVTAVLPNADLAVGRNRFLVGLLDSTNRPITDAQVQLQFYFLQDEQPTVRAKTDAVFRGEGLGDRGVYVATVEFPQAGPWGVEVFAMRGATQLPTTRWSFSVLRQGRTPAVGSPALRSRNPTLKDGHDPAALCTAVSPCDMHDLAIADLVGKGRPIAVYFGTPGFCSSRVCGPGLEVVQKLKQRFGDKVDFVHVEIYKDPRNGVVADTVAEWRLPSEPWLFLVDGKGNIVEKFEAAITLAEVEPAIVKLVN